VCTNAADFARELAAAIDGETVAEFQAKHRSADMLVFEDLAQLFGRRAALVEFQHTLDALEAHEAQVIVTSCAPPADISGLPAGLVSRLSSGLVVMLSPPASAARRVLLERFVAAYGIQCGAPTLGLLTEKLRGTAPQLKGAIMELAAWLGSANREKTLVVELDQAKRFLASRRGGLRPHLKDVGLAVAKFYGLKAAALASSSRRRQVALARSVAMYLGRLLAGASLAALGRHFGGRDHTTALHSCRSIERRLLRDAELRGALGTLERMLSAT
jgi:chromosomal replication initiator protein